MIEVIIVEDHRLIREGLKLLLQDEDQVKVVAEAANGQELLDLLQKKNNADVIMMDINMPVMDGIEACKRVKQLYPKTNILALSMHESKEYINKMLQAGASGYICKTSSNAEMVDAIRKIANGEPFFSPEYSSEQDPIIPNIPFPNQVSNVPAGEKLSNRELEVLKLMAEGLTNQEIADKLFNSKRTIETHRMNILEKTNCRNTASLIKYALQHNIIS